MSRVKIKPDVVVLPSFKGHKFVSKISSNTKDEYPEVLFLRTKVCITPKIKQKNYEQEMIIVREEFENFVKKYIKTVEVYDRKNYIFDIDITKKGVNFNKKSHFHYDIFLRPLVRLTFGEHKDNIIKISNILNEKLYCLFEENGFASD